MKILLSGRIDICRNEEVRTYFLSIRDSLKAHGHKVEYLPNSHDHLLPMYEDVDLLLDVECGRGYDGKLRFVGSEKKPPMKSAVLFTDSHGNPTLHRRISKNYDHVFYAVWDRRSLFDKHPSAHWLPNYADMKYFDGAKYRDLEPEFDWGFFGSKHGLVRADPMVALCKKHGWSYDVREIGNQFKHRWPRTAMAMASCRYLFNHGQKWDLNFRVFESMAVGRCLVNDRNDRSGIDQLFDEGVHYVRYDSVTYDGLEDAMLWCVNQRSDAQRVARNAFAEVSMKHTVHNRVETILSVVS